MPEKLLEEIVVALDCSRSMLRTDYTPNRFVAAKKALLAFIQGRLKNQAATQIALVSFGDKVRKEREFTNQLSDIEETLKHIPVGGKSPLGNALGIAVQILIGELRKTGAKIHRILIISNGIASKTSIDPLSIARLCAGLNIYIDVIRIGAAESLNILKRLAQTTNGQFFYCTDSTDMIAAATNLGEQMTAARSATDKDDAKIAPLLAQIAGNLLKVSDLSQDQKSVIDNILGKNSDKCVICFKTDDPVTKAPFNISGRYCPNCNNPMHLQLCIHVGPEQDTQRASKDLSVPPLLLPSQDTNRSSQDPPSSRTNEERRSDIHIQ